MSDSSRHFGSQPLTLHDLLDFWVFRSQSRSAGCLYYCPGNFWRLVWSLVSCYRGTIPCLNHASFWRSRACSCTASGHPWSRPSLPPCQRSGERTVSWMWQGAGWPNQFPLLS